MWRVLLALGAACAAARASQDVVRTFSDPVAATGSLFNHLVVDRNTGRVYVGAVNHIYQLSPDLEVAQAIATGPVNDSAQCTFDCPPNFVKKPTDNVNKALVIDYATSRLITCGSVLQGLCSVRNLNNISHDVREVREPVVANNASASTVAFIAPGPPNPPMTQVMYVGVTFTGNSPYRSEVPTVSSRSLEDDRLFMIARTAVTTGTRMFVNSLSRERYPINYVYGFSSEGFSYFLTTQLRGVGSDTYYSKLVRVCHDDENYYSYTEIPMSCMGEGGGNFGYNLVQAAFVGKAGSVLAGELGITAQHDVLFAAFSQSECINTNTPSNLSALCVYSLKAIRRKFMQNIKTCFSGNGSRGLDFISPSHACIGTKLQSISEDFCGLDVNTPLGGEQPVEAVPVAVFQKRLTAVAATATGDYTVVFAGTSDGHLKKIVVESATSAFQYGDIVVDENSPVNKDLFFDTQLMHLYVMTERKVSKVKVQECSVYKSCQTCLGAKDPYCGWCSRENKCSLRPDCQEAAKDPLYWISYRSGRCSILSQVVPHQIQLTTARTLDIVIENLPILKGQFLCAFTALDRTLITNSIRKPYGVNCTTPSADTLPPLPVGQHNITSTLSIRSAQGFDFVATNFTFFDCNTYSSCIQCVSSSFPCDWCIDGNRCTHDTAENCRNDVFVTGVSRAGPSHRSGPEFCPRINSTSDGTNEILVPHGVKKAIKVKVRVIGQFIVQTRFVCRFNIEERVVQVNAQLLADTVYCDAAEFTYTSPAPNVTASFDVIWGGSKPLDNPDNIRLLIYRCNDMADNCGLCLALPEKFGCGWCQGSDSCEVQGQCSAPSVWLERRQICPKTEVDPLHPQLDPSDGITDIKNGTHTQDTCSTFKSCTQCVTSSFSCDWCLDSHRCTHDTAESCKNDILVTGVSRKVPGYRSGPGFCPRINSTSDGTNEILVPHGVKKAIKVKVRVIGQFIVQTRFVCRFNIEERVVQVNAQLLADTVYCDAAEFTYTSPAPNVTASFDVIWGGSKPLDNPDNIRLLIYRCNDMADNCGLCLSLPEKFGCGWCQGSDRCELHGQCSAPSVWLERRQICPKTEVDPLHPQLDPSDGITDIKNGTHTQDTCSTFKSCTQCVTSSFSCDWCLDSHRCTHDTAESCRNDILVTGVGRTGPGYRSGPGFCPRINSTSDGTNEILVPHGVKKAIKVKVRVIGQFIVQTRFVCRFNIEERVVQVNAQLLADTVYCDATEFTYTSRAPNVTASFDVIWGGSKPLDNPDNIRLLIYRCNDMADNCGLCFSLPEKFGCGWCQGSDRCEVQGQCSAPSVWLERRQICPKTEVDPLHPQLDPSDGITDIKNGTHTQDTCSTFKSCTQCVTSSFSCDWCLDSHRCTHDTAESCRNDILVTGVGRTGPGYRSGPGFCPRINSTSDGTNEILVPHGVKKAIKVKVRVIGQFIVQTRFVCRFNIEERVVQLNAQLLADTVYCDATEFTYTSRAPNVTASFDVIWGGSKPLDNPDNIRLLIYRCNDMADNCGLCLSLPEKFGCGWCQGSDRCELQGQCSAPSVWLERRQICPNTEVDPLHPQLDPSEGIMDIKNGTHAQDTCSTYKSCTQCVTSSFSCDWCLDSHRCTHDTAERCKNDILVTGVSRKGPGYCSGPGFCPRINSTSDGTNEILVPHGVKKAIKVKVRVIGQFIVQTRFVCRFNIEERVVQVNAQLLADTVYCDATEFTYTSRAPNVTVAFAVIWGGSKPLDNPDNIRLLIYRCNDMADNCSLCLSLPEKFGCGWCQGSDRCELHGQCSAPSVWLERRQICPKTEVDPLHPQLDPSDGITDIKNGTHTQDTCSTFKSCTQCVTSSFSCDWCLDSHRCTHDTAESCRNDILVTGVGRTGPGYRSGPGFCPRINSTSDGTNEILVPHGVKKAIKVKVRVIGQFIVQTRFVCRFNIEERVVQVNAQLLADTVYCDATEFTYTSRAPNVTVAFAVIWGGSKPLDNPDNIRLLIYRCNDMADNCGLCLSLPEKFGCGWCQGSDRCEVQGQCSAPSVWLERRQICPKTEVDPLHPQLDPSDGITDIKNGTHTQDTCSTFKSCTQCVTSSFSCDWCLDSHRCTHDTAESCKNDILVTGVSRKVPGYRSGPGFCPRINSTSDGTNEILVPHGVKKAIKVKVRVIGQFIVQTRFVCRFNIEERVVQVDAQLLADTVYCDAAEFTYTSPAPNVTASFDVIWGGSKPLDNPDNIRLLIYRCNDMADNCGLCFSLPEKFGCGWCQGSDRCEVQGQCSALSVWLERRQICPKTEVDPLHPQLDPSDGITDIKNGTHTQDTCSTFKSCTQCVTSSFSCDWCLDSHRCTHDTAESCRNDILVTGVGRTGPGYRSGPGFCPRINSTSDGTNEILVPHGVKKAIKVKVRVIGQFIVQTRFVCRFNIEERVVQVNAQLLADTVYCDAAEFTYTSPAPNVTASFDVIWGGSKPLDNPDNIRLLIYRCNDMADNCGLCLSLPEKFGCGWCQGSDRCEVQGQCSAPSVWLERRQICPKTEVDPLHPQLDPSDGITDIKNGTHTQDTCGTFKSCTQCVTSSFSCDWCLDSHRCTHDTAESCRNDILVTGVGRTGPGYRSGPGFCPRINSTSDGTNEILVQHGVKKAIKVKVRVIGQFIVQTRFVCRFNIEERVVQVNAQLLADTVYCDAAEFTYTSPAPNVTASFDVIWGGSKPLDNPDNIRLLIYRCNDMADNCGLCLSLPEKFGCGWCQGSDRCEVQGQCSAPSVWLERRQICPKTEVDPLHPQLDPSDGITDIKNGTHTQDTCSTFKSCTQCVTSSFSCDWCLDSHRCTHDTAESCKNDILVTGVSRKVPGYRSGPGFCPRINSTSDGTNEILVPHGVKKAIKVKVRVIGQFIVQTRFVCRFNIEERVVQVNAQLLADTVYCDAAEFTYTSPAPNVTASFDVIWGGSKPLDNPDNIRLLIYRCNDMADNCGLCFSLPEKFGCGWCQGSDRCEVQGQCSAPSVWLERRQICPKTEIDPLYPQLDPSDGITDIKNGTHTQDTCSTFKSCTQCVTSSFSCDWCLDSHRCTHDTAESCKNDILVTGVSRKVPGYRSGPGFCPRINSTSDGTNEILVPHGVKKAIKVKVRVIGQFIVQTRFVCRFNIEERVVQVNAQLLADTVYCDAAEFTYTSPAPNVTASFAVIWGGSKPLDNPDNIHVLIYRCRDMADNCSLCLSLSEKFGCGWCHDSHSCEVQGQCGAPSVWLDRRHICPKTEVDPSHPQLDPSGGITDVKNGTHTQDTCGTFKSCTQCVTSSFSCDWCLDSHRCIHDTAESCRNDILVTGVGRTGPGYRSGPGFCPRINSTSDGTNEILVPHGVKKDIKVKVRVIGQFIVQTRFVCWFNIEERVVQVNAQLLADTVYCDPTEFTYTSRAPNVTVAFAVIWGGSKPLDNPDNIRLLIYRCNDMADNCGLCLSLPEKFGCGWCQGSDRCEVQGQCSAPSVWLERRQICPKTEIDPLYPQLDPSDGITDIKNGTHTQDTCSTFKSCTQCVTSSFSCEWCLDSHRCTHDTAESCRTDILVTGVGRTGPGYRSGPGFCPRINSTSDGTNEILVPHGVKKAIKVKVRVIGQFIVQTRFVCRFNIEERVVQVNAQLLADTVYCDAAEFTYTSPAPNVTASLAVIWGGSKPLDNPDNIHLLIYRCSDMADNCSLCLSLSEKFGCGWCHDSHSCEVQGQCGAPSVWLDRRHICPKTEVDPSHPQLDPSGGITDVKNGTHTQDTCGTFKSCTQCVTSSFSCDWCLDSHRCIHDTAESCRNDILVTGVGRTGPGYRSGPGFCPRINSTSDGTNEILVPHGVKKAIKVKVRVIGQFIVQTRFVCRFNIEERVVQVNAQLLADTVYCDAAEFTYTSPAPNVTASFDVIWGGSKPLDNPDNVHLLIYRCKDMADNCGICLSLPERFGCGWCHGSHRCEVQGQCGAPSVWLDRRQTCPNPEVHASFP